MVMLLPLTLYKISLLLFFCSLCLSYLLTPLIRRFSIHFNILDDPTLARKSHKQPIPLLGGIAIFLSFSITLGLLFLITQYYYWVAGENYFFFKMTDLFWIKVGIYLVASLLVLLVGIMDDLKCLEFRIKLLVQGLAALIIIFGGSRLSISPWPFVNVIISFLWIVCLTNSFNLLDNMNGLSTGLSTIVILFSILVSYFTQHYLLAIFLIIPLGCFMGFLPHNFPRAKIFLGDSGSLFIGFSLATFSIWLFNYVSQQATMGTALLMLLIMMSIPLCDTLTVIAIRLKNRKRIYIGDTNHLSHQLVRVGFSATSAVLILYMSSIFIGTLGILFYLRTI